MRKNDELKLYRGEDYVVSDKIIISQPTLGEICDYGEEEYFSMIYQLTATPQSMKWQLWEMGIDYTQITPFELFYSMLYVLYPKEKTRILFGDLDFRSFDVIKKSDDDLIALRQVIQDDSILIDEAIYDQIMDYIRQVHGIPKDDKMPANDSTKMILLEDAREEIERSKNKPRHSQLKNMISSMINSEGFKYNHSNVWDMKINAFMDSVKRISKIKNADLLLQSGYSGLGINLKDVSTKQIDWLGELD